MSAMKFITYTLFATALFSPTALAQFDNTWIRFTPDQTRIRDSNGASAGYILGDAQEKDFAMGDFNLDGWTDLVVMRKQPFTSSGAFPNYLLMNEGGILVDRSAQHASDSDVPGDLGFLTPTNDRDVVIVDVNLDGWLDVVTCTTLSDGQPHHISHPRVYLNQGAINGLWQGLRFEDGRMPTFSIAPRFCGVAAGDVTGDGAPDLYFTDYGSLEDKLLVNDGNGFFTDSGTSRMAGYMLTSGFGTAAHISDMNLDGLMDVVRTQAGSTSVAYNDPANPGYFSVAMYQAYVSSGSTYHSDVGDLNRDNRPDMIFSDDGLDNRRFNTGNDSLGRVIWSASIPYTFVTGSDDGFAGSCHIADLDNDGWPEALHANVDVDIPGCGTRCHIYHNLGGAIGSAVVLKEEAGLATGPWRGVVGTTAADLGAMYDFAILDIDHDGDLDMVFGRCSGTFVWMNQLITTPTAATFTYGDTNVNSTGQKASISATGTPGAGANDFVLRAEGLPALTSTVFLYGEVRLWAGVPFGDGQRWTGGTLQRLPTVVSDASGVATTTCDFTSWPMSSITIGSERDAQAWFRDTAAGAGHSNSSNALAFWRVD